MWSIMVEETGEPGENHQPWMGDHHPATCRSQELGCKGDKLESYPCTIQAPFHMGKYLVKL